MAEGFLPYKEMDLIDMPGMNASRREPSHPRNLETIYKHYQTVSGDSTERPTQLKVRSMAIGDAIVIDGTCVLRCCFRFRDARQGRLDHTGRGRRRTAAATK
jgi:hypothetical protein